MNPTSLSDTDWKIRIYRVQDERSQQRILSVFHRIDRPGVVALGTQSGPDWFVIVECDTIAAQIRAQRTVMAIDPQAVRTYECEARPEDARTRPTSFRNQHR